MSSAIQQVLAEIGDLEEPLGQFPLFDQRAGTPAAAIDDLLVGQHGHVLRIPVDLGILAVDQTLFQEIEKEILLALVVFDVAGGKFARPVERQAHRLQLAAHGGDVFVGPGLGVDLVLHRRIFSRHAEGVPAHRMQHVVAAGALVAGHDVAHRIVAHMAHMDAAGRIGEHLKHIVFLARIVVVGRRRPCLRSISPANGVRRRADCNVLLPCSSEIPEIMGRIGPDLHHESRPSVKFCSLQAKLWLFGHVDATLLQQS